MTTRLGTRRVDRAEEDHAGPGGQLDAGHAAGGAALRADAGRGEAQQLGVGGDEDEVRRSSVQLDGADDRVAVPEADDLPVVPVARVVGGDPLDDALGGAERETGGVASTAR